jgi:hypothetical protein
MSIRTFWTLFLKILGIWLILKCLTVIPQLFAALPLWNSNQSNNITDVVIINTVLLVTLAIFLLLIRLLVFRPTWIIDKLKLDKGFREETIDLNVKSTTVLTIAIILIGGLIFVDALPVLFRQVFIFIQQKNTFIEAPESGSIIFYLVKTLIGWLLMTNSRYVIGFIRNRESGE